MTYEPAQSRGSAFGKDNVIPEQALVTGDMRALSTAQFAAAQKAMAAIVAESLPHTTATITFDEGYPPLAPTDGNRRLLALYDQASQDIGAGAVTAVNPDRAGAADVSFVAGVVPMILDGVGMRGDGGHTVERDRRSRHVPDADHARGGSPVPARNHCAALTLHPDPFRGAAAGCSASSSVEALTMSTDIGTHLMNAAYH